MARLSTTSIFCASILALFFTSAGNATSLVVNGGFESGDFTSWLTEPSSQGSDFGVSTTDPHWGNYSAYFADAVAGNYDGISQVINTLPNTAYQLTFWLSVNTASLSPFVFRSPSTPVNAPPPASVDDFQIIWNGDVIGDFSTSKVTQYGQYTLSIPASSIGGNNTLGFQAYNSGVGTFLDDISLTPLATDPVPEPGTLGLLSIVLLGVGASGLALKPMQGSDRIKA